MVHSLPTPRLSVRPHQMPTGCPRHARQHGRVGKTLAPANWLTDRIILANWMIYLLFRLFPETLVLSIRPSSLFPKLVSAAADLVLAVGHVIFHLGCLCKNLGGRGSSQ